MLDALGNVGDFVGGIGVVITLIYLARQIHHNSASIEATAVQAASHSVAEALEALAKEPSLVIIYSKGCKDYESLNDTEKLQYSLLMGSILHRFEGLLVIRDRGLLPPNAMDGSVNRVIGAFQQKGTLAWWETGKSVFNPMLQDWIDEEIIGTRSNQSRDEG